jgi:hypothetical protein
LLYYNELFLIIIDIVINIYVDIITIVDVVINIDVDVITNIAINIDDNIQ